MVRLGARGRGIGVSILHGTEPWGQCSRTRTNYGPEEWESWLFARGFATKRTSIRQVGTPEEGPPTIATVNPFGEDYPEEEPESLRSLGRIVEYVEQGGIFVCTGGWPFYYANSPRGRVADGTRLSQLFHVDVDSGQWWEDVEPVAQLESSLVRYATLL